MHAVKPNNKKTIILTLKSNATNVVTSSDKTTYNKFPAKDKICSKCAKRGHFAESCRSGSVSYLGDRKNEEEQDETESKSQGTELDPVAFADFTRICVTRIHKSR